MSTPLSAPASFDGLVSLSGRWGVIRAQGPDAAAFLHSQLTQGVTSLGDGEARLAGYCSAKGRLLATFVVWREAPDDIRLACSADLLAPTLKRLSMYVLRSKCRLTDASAEVPLFGVLGVDACIGSGAPLDAWGRAGRDDLQLIRLPSDGSGVPRCLGAGAVDRWPSSLHALDIRTWEWLEVRCGVPRIAASTVERFVPQMVNLEQVSGVDFHKGCYPGQEIVARSQYRGTTKRRMSLFECAAPLQAGQEVFHPADPGQPAGMVVLAASIAPERHCALVSVKTDLLDSDALYAGLPTERLAPAPLPYPLAVAAEA